MAEDLPNASFAGQHDSFINVRGESRPDSKLAGNALPRFSPYSEPSIIETRTVLIT